MRSSTQTDLTSASEARSWDPDLALRLIRDRISSEGPLLPILHAFQDAFGCIPDPAASLIAEELNLSRAEVHGVISFYHDFRREPAGRLMIKLCRAEACQAMGARDASEALLKHLRLAWGETSSDKSVTIEPVYCLGLCAVAPAALVNGAPIGRLTAQRLIDLADGAQ